MQRGQRGGSWGHLEDGLRSSTSYIKSTDYEDGTFGFRLAAIPEPSTGLLTLLSTAVLLRRRRS
jgi:hypothetical protein